MTLKFNKFLYDWLKENQLYDHVINCIINENIRRIRPQNIKTINNIDSFCWDHSSLGSNYWLIKYYDTLKQCTKCIEQIEIKTNEKA